MPARANWLIVAWLLTGCAGYELAPLAANHPAHPEAPVAPEPAPSQTLAYSRADIPSVQPVSPVTAAPHEGHGSRPAEAGSSPTVVGEGEVIATVPNASQIVVEHGEIKGFMEAMTMGYRVDPASLLAGLKQGDKVRFTIDVQRRAIVGIEKLQ
jgi:Cu/Ag efflux protein CusF